MEKYVLCNINDGSYFQCFTEHDTIFLTKHIEDAEVFNSISYARKTIAWSQKDGVRYLRDEDDSVVKEEVKFQIGTIEYKFVLVE